jgi:hypothetical protein
VPPAVVVEGTETATDRDPGDLVYPAAYRRYRSGGKSSSTTTPTPSALKVAPATYSVQLVATDEVTTSKMPPSLIVQ